MGVPVGSALQMREVSAAPAANPPSGSVLLYTKSDGKVYTKDSTGAEVLVGPSTATTPTVTAVTDWNSATTTGYYTGAYNATNTPVADAMIGYAEVAPISGTTYIFQRVWSLDPPSTSQSSSYSRYNDGTKWYPWQKELRTQDELDARYAKPAFIYCQTNTSQTITAGTTMTRTGWNSVQQDGAWSATGGAWTVPVAGKYEIEGLVTVTGTSTANVRFYCDVVINGTTSIQQNSMIVGNRFCGLPFGVTYRLNAGDTVQIDMNCAGVNLSTVASSPCNTLTINWVGQ